MAEGFARAYGSDVMVAASAGLAPALMVAFDTQRAMKEKNISLDDHFPKSLHQLSMVRFDLIVNLSGSELPPKDVTCPVRVWKVRDPIGTKYGVHCEIRDEIEKLVMDLILEMRRNGKFAAGN
jgi:protein-tyrosine-phosphatase